MADHTHQVQNNKDLDLPTQQELLAQFRCDEIAAVAVSKFLAGGVKDVRKVVERGDVVEGLGAVMAGWRDGAISKIPPYASFEASIDDKTCSALRSCSLAVS